MKRSFPRLALLLLGGLGALSARAQTVVQNTTYTTTTTVVGPSTIVADTDVTVSSGADVTFQASGSVTLGPGFTAVSGSAFHALIVAPPIIISPSSAGGAVGVAFGYAITADNLPTSFNATGLPGGLSINTSTGLISGTPTTAGASSVSLSATNALGTGTATLTLVISSTTPVITSATSGTGTVDVSFSYSITATHTPTSFNATGLPGGLGINPSTGVISGTPTTAGTSSIGLSATNASGTGTTTLSLVISAGPPVTPVITSATSGNGTVGVSFNYFITAAHLPTSFAATSLPGGLGVNTSTGLISGTPTGTGTSSIGLSATNTAGTGTATLTLTIGAFSSDTSNQSELNLHLPLVP